PEIPWAFNDCSADDLIILISHMLNLLIEHNDQVVLTPDALTRFHSRAAPGISVIEYLRRIVKYTNMEKIPLLSLLAYIDLTCAHLPTFTLSTLTVHRFLIAGVCAGSKAQCDVFCTNSHYAKVGGIKVGELNALEREFLRVTQWNLCCNADLLQRYYTSLIRSHGGFTQAPAPAVPPFRAFPRSVSKPPASDGGSEEAMEG
ncbi:cyclin-domain-containing protein, partial [Dioszegia hungarica]